MTAAGGALRLDGRTVLVTGAGGGIGAGIAVVVAGCGATVAVNDRDETLAAATVKTIEELGGTAFPVTGDLTVESVCRTVVDGCVQRTGRIDGLVNNAGIPGLPMFEDIDQQMWDRVLDLNLAAPFRLISLVVPQMRRQGGGGRIVNIASIAGTRISVLGGAAYTASKAGLIGLTRHLAVELGRDAITVNAVLPGVTMTPLVVGHTDEDRLRQIANSVPVGRIGSPADIGWMSAFLLSEQAGYVSGAAVEVDGAITALPGNYESYQAVRGQEVR